jgi:hypothetical protein
MKPSGPYGGRFEAADAVRPGAIRSVARPPVTGHHGRRRRGAVERPCQANQRIAGQRRIPFAQAYGRGAEQRFPTFTRTQGETGEVRCLPWLISLSLPSS